MKTIKEIREYSGLSQKKFAGKYGIPVRSIENWESGARKCPEYLTSLLERAAVEDFKKFQVEYAFAENVTAVEEWHKLGVFTKETAEQAAEEAAGTDGLEEALFRVWRMVPDEFGTLEKTGEPEFFSF